MFEAAEVGRKLEKEIYKAQVPILRAELLDAQQQLLLAPFPVIVLFAGVDAAGKSETASLLNEWMDPRWITDEDWRNRGRWTNYTLAVNEMVARTSTRVAPWTLIEGNDKDFARIKVLKTPADRLERRLRK
jgi:polyphosphate kinase 2 (PPK2 family)